MVNIKLDKVCLNYPVYSHSTLSLKGTFVSLVSAGRISKINNSTSNVSAIEDLSFTLNVGDRLAVIGGNGAGKTSLLKLIAGIYSPTSGKSEVEGKVTTILGTGFGLDDEASGYQNILLGGVTLGYSLNRMRSCFEDITAFTELGEFLHMPLRTYSAGMRARLAFAIATCMKPDILTIDEGIGAGDVQFMKKANKRLESFLSNASILIMASHSEELLKRFCNKCLYMHKGKNLFFGNLKEGMQLYKEDYRRGYN